MSKLSNPEIIEWIIKDPSEQLREMGSSDEVIAKTAPTIINDRKDQVFGAILSRASVLQEELAQRQEDLDKELSAFRQFFGEISTGSENKISYSEYHQVTLGDLLEARDRLYPATEFKEKNRPGKAEINILGRGLYRREQIIDIDETDERSVDGYKLLDLLQNEHVSEVGPKRKKIIIELVEEVLTFPGTEQATV